MSADLVDLAPTVLALLGLPVPDDLPGEVLVEILEPAFLKRYPIRRIPTYEGIVPRRSNPSLPSAPGQGAPGEENLRSQLEALGYLEPAGADAPSEAHKTRNDDRNG